MIGDKRIGSDFGGLIQYALQKSGAERLNCGTLMGQTPRELSQEVSWILKSRPDVSKPVLHRMLSLARGEKMEKGMWEHIVNRYMKGMGLFNCPWVAFKHRDAECEHIHICSISIDPTKLDKKKD